MSTAVFDQDSRLLLIAPHPDDESLACGVVLQRAVQAGSAIKVIYITDGENNPWPQRAVERKWRLETADRDRWSKIRRVEALAALQVLGVETRAASFLGLPDQELTTLLTRDSASVLRRLSAIISEGKPTHAIVPSTFDLHPDHSAVAVMIRAILPVLVSEDIAASVWSYSVHGRSRAFFSRAETITGSQAERLTKRRAIRCHETQLKLSKRRFLRYVERPERFVNWSASDPALVDGSIRSIVRQAHSLRISVRLSPGIMALADPTLFLLSRDESGTLHCLNLRLPVRSSRVQMFDCETQRRVAVARYRGNALGGELTVPLISSSRTIFVKLKRRSWFFDEAGWLEAPPDRSEVEARNAIPSTRAPSYSLAVQT